MQFSDIFALLLVVLFVAEQVAIKFHLPYPYRYGFIVYKTSIEIPSVGELKLIESAKLKFTSSLKRFISPLRFYSYNLNETYFCRVYVSMNLFEPSIFTGQVITKRDGKSELFIRVGYATLVSLVTILISLLIKNGILACIVVVFLMALALSSFYSSFQSYCSALPSLTQK